MGGSSTRITIRNDSADLPLLQDALDRFGQAHGITQQVLNQLQIVLDEIASNVIKYAWPGGGAHDLTVAFSFGNGTFEIEIMDDGAPFNPLETPARPRAPGVRPKPGGVGIRMARKLVDGMEYARVGSRNRVTLKKRCL